jgi:acetyl esterase/lipase
MNVSLQLVTDMENLKRRSFIQKSSLLLGAMGLNRIDQNLAPRDPEPDFKFEEIYLWDDNSTNNGSNPAYRPKITIYYPALRGNLKDKQKLAAVLICPGGGYHIQAPHEGQPFAQLFALYGIVGVVLTYRVNPDRWPAAYSDATRAMHLLKDNAERLNLDPEKIGIMGFSAGGHLASTVATQPDLYRNPEDELNGRFSARPNRVILGYPVISFVDSPHMGSAKALLGENPDPVMARQLSNEKQVTDNNPPAFLFHLADDKAVPVQNSLMFAQACIEHNVPVELHVFPAGGHGVGMALEYPEIRTWVDNLMNWLSSWQLKG